jgi:hypothetical protein
MPNINKDATYVEQEMASKALVLYAGDITLMVMSNFEEACIAFFKTKDIEDNKQVKRILLGLQDSCVRNWIMSDRDRI